MPDSAQSEPAYILHVRPYRETSRMLEVFSQNVGRIGLVARGAQRPRSRFRGLLDPFRPLSLGWTGRGDLKTLTHADNAGSCLDLAGNRVMAGFYMNELMLKLTERGDPHPDLFAHYATSLVALAGNDSAEVVLRRFELLLLDEIGYGLSLATDALEHAPIDPAGHYEYRIEQGLVPVSASLGEAGQLVFRGEEILAISRLQLDCPDILRAAKRLLRSVINHHLGGRVLKTRQVVAAMRS